MRQMLKVVVVVIQNVQMLFGGYNLSRKVIWQMTTTIIFPSPFFLHFLTDRVLSLNLTVDCIIKRNEVPSKKQFHFEPIKN